MAPTIDPTTAATRLAVIVVNYRTPDLALACLDALADQRRSIPDLTVILVDGGSADGSAERMAAGVVDRGFGDWVELMPLPVNGGFGYANNQALLLLAERTMPPDFICLINPDARPLSDSLARMVAILAAHPAAGAVGGRLEGTDGKAQGCAFTFPTILGELSRGSNTDLIRHLTRSPPIALAPDHPQPVPWVTGAAVTFRLEALRRVGLFDDGFFLYFEEVELMRRLARGGWQIWHEPGARVEHIGGTATDIRWDEDGFHKPMPLPAYWYRSRRRYLVRTSGPAFAPLATACFLLGRLLWLARCGLQRRPDRFPRRTSRDMLRHSFWPSRADRAAATLPRLGDRRGAMPRWLRPDAGT